MGVHKSYYLCTTFTRRPHDTDGITAVVYQHLTCAYNCHGHYSCQYCNRALNREMHVCIT